MGPKSVSSRNLPLLQGGRPTTFMIRQWTQKGGAQPLRSMVYLNADRTAAPHFRSLWALAFPTREDLPAGELVDAAGVATDAFWRVWS